MSQYHNGRWTSIHLFDRSDFGRVFVVTSLGCLMDVHGSSNKCQKLKFMVDMYSYYRKTCRGVDLSISFVDVMKAD